MPLDRLMISLRMLSPNLLAAGITWRPYDPIAYFSFDYADRDKGIYESSPFKVVHETNAWLELDLSKTPDERFAIIPDLKKEGMCHYLVVPMWFSAGLPNSLSFATKDEAVAYAKENGIAFRLEEPPVSKIRPKSYAENFKYGREGLIGARVKEIGTHSIRAGNIVGEHEVLFAGNQEQIRLSHQAQSRDCFSKGARIAIKWIANKKDGKIHSMNDVLEL